MRIRPLLIGLALLPFAGRAQVAPRANYAGAFFDAHAHTIKDGSTTTAAVLGQLSAAGVTAMYLFGSEAETLPLQQSQPSVIYPFAQFPILRDGSGDQAQLVFDSTTAPYVEAQLMKGMRGVGELGVRHNNTFSATYSGYPVQGSVMLDVYDLVARYNVPISMHIDSGYTSELDAAAGLKPRTTMIWTHAGDTTATAVRDLMRAHGNLFADLSTRHRLGWKPRPTTSATDQQALADASNVLLSTWKAVLEEFPDRFMFGIDATDRSRASEIGTVVEYYRVLLGQVSPSIAEKIAYKNAIAILQGKEHGATPGAIDLNGDRDGDVFRYTAATGAWSIETAARTGSFTAAAGAWSGGWRVLAADFNGDRVTDFFLYNPSSGGWYKAIGNGAGGFSYFPSQWDVGWDPYVLELNGDGKSDVFIYNAATGAWYKCVSEGDGTGNFAYYPGAWSTGWRLYPADWDGNGRADLFLYSGTTGQWFRATNDGGAGFLLYTETWSNGWTIYPGDFSGDGKTDLFLSDSTGTWIVATNTGTTFSYASGWWLPGYSISTGDFDDNGLIDVFLYAPASGEWFECLANGAGGFTYHTGRWETGLQAYVTDFNSDRSSDVLLYNSATGAYYKMTNTGPGSFSQATGTWRAGETIVASATRLP